MEDTFYLEEASLDADSEDGFQYDEVPADDVYSISGDEGEEDFDTTVQIIEEKANNSPVAVNTEEETNIVVSRKRPEVTEDFVRNFLVRMNMMATLDCFQTEWYEFKEKQILKEEYSSNVPDIYIRNRQLDEKVNSLQIDLDKYKDAANKSKEIHLKLRKERDFHKMHHKRIVQEKDKLISEIKRLKQHYESYEPTLKALRNKYEAAMKEKMLTKLERDRAVAQIEGLQSTNHFNALEGAQSMALSTKSKPSMIGCSLEPSPTQRHPNDSEFPPDKGVNPMLSKKLTPCTHLTRSGGYRLTNSFTAHDMSVSGMALHPSKQLLATVSDDKLWKLWSIPEGEIVMTGEGHTDWLSDCEFNPQGTQLATTSGDTTVKIWDFSQEKCVMSFPDHTHAVWGCSWHSSGDFLATCAMDGTSKIWDLNSVRCRYTLRGHADSVNSIEFLPFSNILCTCSADKTISLWDGRTGLCEQILYDHPHAINHATFSLQGDKLASCDAYGITNLWDIRTLKIIASINFGTYPVNRVAFDPAGSVLAAASHDGTIYMYDITKMTTSTLKGHEDSIQSVIFDRNCEYLLSSSSDMSVKMWS